jgi:hypothetical protein
MVKSILYGASAFIDAGSTPLRNLVKGRILSETIMQNLVKETLNNGETAIEKISENLYGDYNTLYQPNLSQVAFTCFLMIFATYHNYNMVYNKTQYINSSLVTFTQWCKIAIMVVFFVLSKNVEPVE